MCGRMGLERIAGELPSCGGFSYSLVQSGQCVGVLPDHGYLLLAENP